MKIITGLLLITTVSFAKPAPLNADKIIKITDEFRSPKGTISFQVRVREYNAKEMSKETIYKVYSSGTQKSLVETIAPRRLAGRKLLMANSLWLYLPSLRKPTMVSTQQRLTGEVSNGDIARLSFSEDYTPKILGLAKLGNENTIKLELIAKHSDAPYRKIHLWVKAKNYQPLHATYFALSGKPLKYGDFSDPKAILGGTRMTRLKLQDALQKERTSDLVFYNYQREQLGDSFFDKESINE